MTQMLTHILTLINQNKATWCLWWCCLVEDIKWERMGACALKKTNIVDAAEVHKLQVNEWMFSMSHNFPENKQSWAWRQYSWVSDILTQSKDTAACGQWFTALALQPCSALCLWVADWPTQTRWVELNQPTWALPHIYSRTLGHHTF